MKFHMVHIVFVKKKDENDFIYNLDIKLYSRNQYCRFINFCDNFIFTKSIKRHISDVKISRLRQDSPISINDRVILPFRKSFIFTKLCICEVSRKYSPSENFRIYSIHCIWTLTSKPVFGVFR